MTITDEELRAYVDGELSSDDVARIETAIADDVLIAGRVERAKRLRSQVRGVIQSPVPVPVPAAQSHSTAFAGRASRRSDTATSTSNRQAGTRVSRWRLPAIALVIVVAALAIGNRPHTPESGIQVRNGSLYAGADLAKQLDTALAGSPDSVSTFAIGLTFRDSGGHICRSFVSTPSRIAGLACRDGNAWALSVVSHLDSAAGVTTEPLAYMPADVLAAVNARTQGIAFDARREREARDSGWR